jgi:hypothetical protein
LAQGKILYKLLGVLAGLVFIIYGFVERSDISRVKRLGQSAVVAPISGYTAHKSRGSTTYTAEFRFKTDRGVEVVQKHSFPEELVADFKAGVPVRVTYLPNDPTTFVFEKDRPSWTLVVIGAALAIAALLLA